MPDYTNLKTRRIYRYLREDRIRTSEIRQREDEYSGHDGLMRKKKEVISDMNDMIKETILDLLHHTCPGRTDEISQKLEVQVYDVYPTPINRIDKAVEFIKGQGIDTTTALWCIQIGVLRVQVDRKTNPNNFYITDGY